MIHVSLNFGFKGLHSVFRFQFPLRKSSPVSYGVSLFSEVIEELRNLQQREVGRCLYMNINATVAKRSLKSWSLEVLQR